MSVNEENLYENFSVKLSAPGKVILFGEHSVVYGKSAVAASLGLRTYLNLSEEHNLDKIILNFEAVKLYHTYNIENVKEELFLNETKYVLDKPELNNHEEILAKVETFLKKYSGNAPIQKSQYQALVAFFYLYVSMTKRSHLIPFTVTVTSDLDIGSGLGSSASFLVVVSAAFYELVKHKSQHLSIEDFNELSFHNLDFNKKKFSQQDLDLISKWAYNAEKIIHGTPSGLDNTICTYGMMVEYKKGSPIIPLDLKHKLQVILINSKVPKNTKVQVEKVATLKTKYPEIIGHILNGMDEISAKTLSVLKSWNADDSKKLYAILDDCVDINQCLLSSLGVSHSSLNDICNILLEKKLHGKLTGAGGGGYAFGFIPEGFPSEDLSYVIDKLVKKGYEARIVELGGSGLVRY